MLRPNLPLLLLLLAFTTGCAEHGPNSGLPTTDMRIGSATYKLEIANTDATRERGLMERDSMPANRGMIFVFDELRELSFWMKNTRIPLEILYLDADGRVVSIHEMKPYDRRSIPSDRPAKYAIELNVGQVKTAGVKVGDVLQIPASAREAVN
jgi:uncharacterized membrane protein (UPF0127 family)